MGVVEDAEGVAEGVMEYDMPMPSEPVTQMECVYQDERIIVFEPTWWCVFRDALAKTRAGYLPWRDDNTPGWKGDRAPSRSIIMEMLAAQMPAVTMDCLIYEEI